MPRCWLLPAVPHPARHTDLRRDPKVLRRRRRTSSSLPGPSPSPLEAREVPLRPGAKAGSTVVVVLFPALRLRDSGRRSHLNLETQVAVWRVPRDRDGDLGKRTLGTGHPATLLPPAEAQRLPPIQKAEHRVPGACGRVRRADGAGRRGDAFGSLSLPRGLSTSIASFCLPRAGRHLSCTVSPSASPVTHLFVSPQICPPVAVGPRALPAVTSEAGGGGCQALDWTPWDSGPSFSEPLETGPGSRDSILGSEDVLVPFLSSFLSLWLGLVRSPLLLPAPVAPTQPLPRAPPGCPAC